MLITWSYIVKLLCGEYNKTHFCGVLCSIHPYLHAYVMGQVAWTRLGTNSNALDHDDVIKWKHFPRYWPFVRGIHRSPVNSPHKGQWRGALMFTLICVRINGWVNNCKTCDLRRNRGHYDVIVMCAHHRWRITMSFDDDIITAHLQDFVTLHSLQSFARVKKIQNPIELPS